MTEHPILFSGAMVRAILDGRKTQTRRCVRFAEGLKRDHPLADSSAWGAAYPHPNGGWVFTDKPWPAGLLRPCRWKNFSSSPPSSG